MSGNKSKKQEVLALLAVDKKGLEKLDEAELVSLMERLEVVKGEAVREGRFLGKPIRR